MSNQSDLSLPTGHPRLNASPNDTVISESNVNEPIIVNQRPFDSDAFLNRIMAAQFNQNLLPPPSLRTPQDYDIANILLELQNPRINPIEQQ